MEYDVLHHDFMCFLLSVCSYLDDVNSASSLYATELCLPAMDNAFSTILYIFPCLVCLEENRQLSVGLKKFIRQSVVEILTSSGHMFLLLKRLRILNAQKSIEPNLRLIAWYCIAYLSPWLNYVQLYIRNQYVPWNLLLIWGLV